MFARGIDLCQNTELHFPILSTVLFQDVFHNLICTFSLSAPLDTSCISNFTLNISGKSSRWKTYTISLQSFES